MRHTFHNRASRFTELSAGEILLRIGSGAACDIRIRTNHPEVALLIKRQDRVFIRDLGTGEDVLINGNRLPARGDLDPI